MGFPPPPDLPSPEVQDSISLSANFSAGLPAASLCGFALPSFLFSFGLSLDIPFPPSLPFPFLSIGLSCDLSNPLNISAGIKPGGGRTPTFDPDPDDGPFT